MANLQVRLDDQLKNEAQDIAAGMGLDLTTAVRMFLKQMVTDKGLPFRPSADPFYNDYNQERLSKAIEDFKNGVNYAEHSLIED